MHAGSLTNGFRWSRRRGKRSMHSQGMRNPQFYVSGKRPMQFGVPSRVAIMKLMQMACWRFSIWHHTVGPLFTKSRDGLKPRDWPAAIRIFNSAELSSMGEYQLYEQVCFRKGDNTLHVKYQNDWESINPNLMALSLHGILRFDVLPFSE